MRIVIDMQGAQTESRFRGIGRYTMSFAKAVVRNGEEHEILLALSGLFPDTIEPIRAEFEGLLPQANIRVWNVPGPVREDSSSNDVRRETAELAREAFLASLQPDMIHVSSLFEGYVDDAVTSIGRFDLVTPVSVTLYDLIPLLNPEQYLKPNPPYKKYYDQKVDYLKKSTICLAISEFSRKESVDMLPVLCDKSVNISTAIDSCFYQKIVTDEEQSIIREKYGISKPFVLYTGGADERKNLTRLVRAYAALSPCLRKEHQLLFAGKMPNAEISRLTKVALAAGLQHDELIFTGYISDEELIQFYNICKLYVFPSWHEGFGLPALEAMACGAPVIGANRSSLPEVIGHYDGLFDPFDSSSISQKMAQALEDESFRSLLVKRGINQAKNFSWEETAERAIRAWEESHETRTRKMSSRLENAKKPRLAFVSPMPPERTGIADYSAQLLPALSVFYDIEVVVAQERVDYDLACFGGQVRDIAWLRGNVQSIDRVIYQIGNSPFHKHMLELLEEIPGTVVLHDFFLSGLMAWMELHGGLAGAWTQALYASHGYGAVRERYIEAEQAKLSYPVNWNVLQHAQGVVVHSEYSRRLGQSWYENHAIDEWNVIPLVRTPSQRIGKREARAQLGISDSDFIICCFGFLDPTKLNHRLLQAWLASALSGDKSCYLFFVGENHSGDYGANLFKTIRANGLSNRIRITNFLSSDKFQQYLAAADLAVQLRTHSRGETSAAILDCMNHALPVVVNANGPMAEFDPDVLWMLPDNFTDAELVDALETLWCDPEQRHSRGTRAQEIISTLHSPEECAKRYADVIERHRRSNADLTPALIQAIAKYSKVRPDDDYLIQLSSTLASNLPLPRPAKRLFLDLTATFHNDLKTGIERVAKAILTGLLDSPPEGYRIEPVYLSDVGGKLQHRYARHNTLEFLGCPVQALADEPIDPENGDLMLGLDISADKLIQAEHAGLFASYRNLGVNVRWVVYDLLPIRMPTVFPPGASETHENWLRSVSTFDGAICISKSVADDLAAWREEVAINSRNRRPYSIEWWHLGADINESAPSKGLPENAPVILEQLSRRPSFLMVGTIEPRKGYLQAIEAFSQLWSDGIDVNLVIVGKEGWKGLPDDMRRDIPQTVTRLQDHPELDNRLFWLEGISDEYLEQVYAVSTCLIACSYGEGFGLPLIEAAKHKLPIIARDIPVFREVAGGYAKYFSETNSEGLAFEINEWLELWNKNSAPSAKNINFMSWKESLNNLVDILIDDRRENH